MKKCLPLFLGLLLFIILIPVQVHAEEQMQQTSSKSSQMQIVSYDLPYPGMLPDSPIYKLKVLRDKFISFLITNPTKKIEFHLLQADKGISSASMLLDKNEAKLSVETALKAENNMTLIPEQIRRLDTKPSAGFFDKLIKASLKHQELLTRMIKKAHGNEQKTLRQVLGFSKDNLETIEKYEKKNSRRWNEWD